MRGSAASADQARPHPLPTPPGDEPETRAADEAQRTAWLQDISHLRRELTAQWERMSLRYPALTATQQAPTLTVATACQLARDLDATLVEYFQHAQGWCAFVVTPERVQYVALPRLEDELFVQIHESFADKEHTR